MSIGTLYSAPTNGQSKVIKAVVAFAGFTLDDAVYTHYVDNKTPEFLAKFPHGKIPAVEFKDGFRLFEGAPIARYISNLAPKSGLLGHNNKEASLVDQWIHFAETEIDSAIRILSELLRGVITPYSKSVHTLISDRITRSLTTVNTHLATRTFLVTERITLADLFLAISVQRTLLATFDAPLRAKLPHVVRHFETVVNHPVLKAIYGETAYVEKPIAYVPPPKEKKDAKPPAPLVEKKEKEKKPKKKDDDDDDDDEPLVPEEPKAKNPLDSLPKSTFNLEDWKRAYSNKETRGAGGALEWFYENFDKEGFSIWRVDFKYNTELTLTFMSANQVGGFFNRLEASRKYLFGSVGVLGSANDSVISGVFILRGQEAQPVVDVAPDWESYTYEKINLADEKQKAFFEAALAWDLELGGKKWVDGKNFK